MASTYSPSLRLELMATGDQSGTWGDTTNTNLGTLLEQAITGYLSKAMADANQTLTSLNGASDEARNMVVEVTGALTAARNVIVPTAEKVYLFKNSTTGGFAVTIKTAAGTGVAVAAGQTRWVYCDGTNVVLPTGYFTDGVLDVATAATLVLNTAVAPLVNLTGTTTVTAVTLAEGSLRIARAAANFQITVSATLIGNGTGQNVQVKTGDLLIFEGYSGGVVQFWLTRASGTAVAPWNPRDRIVNGDKAVSVENGQTAGTSNGRYISDQNMMTYNSSNGVFTGVNVLTLSPAGGYRDQITITTADSSLAAGELLLYSQAIEGSNLRDAQWGTANAKPVIVRRGFNYPAGTWPVAFQNSANDWSYVTTFTVSGGEAGTDIVREFAIPAQTSGTWLKTDGVIFLTMNAVIGAGSTYQGVAGWQNSFKLTVAGATNGMGSAGAVFQFFDEGLRLDPAGVGVYGPYEVGETDEKFNPTRYARLMEGAFSGVCNAGNSASIVVPNVRPFAKLPTAVNLVNGTLTDGVGVTGVTGASLGLTYLTGSLTMDIATAGSLTAGRGAIVFGQRFLLLARLL